VGGIRKDVEPFKVFGEVQECLKMVGWYYNTIDVVLMARDSDS
jgi:hypothetical protein